MCFLQTFHGLSLFGTPYPDKLLQLPACWHLLIPFSLDTIHLLHFTLSWEPTWLQTEGGDWKLTLSLGSSPSPETEGWKQRGAQSEIQPGVLDVAVLRWSRWQTARVVTWCCVGLEPQQHQGVLPCPSLLSIRPGRCPGACRHTNVCECAPTYTLQLWLAAQV